MIKNQLCAARTQATSKWPGFTNAPLSVQFCINPTRRALATFKVCIFNDDYSLLAEAYGTDPESKSTRIKDDDGTLVTRLDFMARGEYCWFPGEYVAVLYQGREPLYYGCITLLEECGEASLSPLDVYRKGSVDYLAARDLYQSNVFRSLPFDCGESLFKQQLSEVYAREQSETALGAEESGTEEFGLDLQRLLVLESSTEERSKQSHNLVVKVTDGHEASALSGIVQALPMLSHPNVSDFKREVWNIREMVEKGNGALPSVPLASTLILCNVDYFMEGGESGRRLAQQFLEALSQRRYVGNRIVLFGRVEVIDRLLAEFDDFLIDFPERNHLMINAGATLIYFTHELFTQLCRQHFELSSEVERRITWCLYERWKEGRRYDLPMLEHLVEGIKDMHASNLLQCLDENEEYANAVACELCYDEFEAVLNEHDERHRVQATRRNQVPEMAAFVDMNDCAEMEALNGMVGLGRVKAEVTQAITMARFEALRRHYKLDEGGTGRHHMLFMGNPGTGKTTVAKLIGGIYHRMGLLSSGHTVACDRSTLMGQFIGESEQKVREVVESARGGVLFVDEAYSLFADEKDRDFGRHVINCMLPILAEPDPDMIVIFAGYRDKMEELFKVNPGLRDRFPLSLHFDDYSSDELLGIIRHLASTRHFTFAPEAEADVRRIIEAVIAQRDPHFSNARWATNLFELGILRAMAQRVVNALSSAADEETRRSLLAEQETLSLITLDDVRQAETQYLGTMAPRRTAVQRIGFLVQSA